jgi:uncharacterized membrane protein YkvA (DUF1232 family)
MNNPLNRNSFGGGFIGDILTKLRLALELFKDPRVSIWTKAIPVISLLYLIVPLDLLIGPIDDAVILYVGMDFFIDLCPNEVVSEHLARIKGKPMESNKDEDVIDVDFKEK